MIIGLSVNHKEELSCISNAYVNAIIKAGGSPVLIPLTNDKQVLNEILSRIDGLVLSGGGDLHSSFFNEELHPAVESYDLERDLYDIQLVRLAAEKQIPILGICRGHQVINIAFGGNIFQDIPSQIPHSNINHSQTEVREKGTHKVNIIPGTLLSAITKKEAFSVNSFHHQAVNRIAPGFIESASSEDGVNEAIESSEGKAILGVQWHPENMTVAGNDTMLSLFKYITSEAELYRLAKEIHQRIFTIDSHCDTPMYFRYGIDIGKRNSPFFLNPGDLGATDENQTVQYNLKVDIPKMQEGMLDAVFMVAYLKQGKRDEQSLQKTVRKTEKILNELILQIKNNSETAGLARNKEDLVTLKKEGKKAIFIGIENGYGIGKDMNNLHKFTDMGISYMTLSHNGDNDICDSAVQSNKEHNGLSDFGKDVVKEMNRLGIMIDISHTSEKTSFDVLEISEYPVIASHSASKALHNHPRNISDKLMKTIAEKGGVIQVCFYTYFLRNDKKATVKDIVNHIDHIVKTVGINYVGIGSDFDGGGEVIGLKAANEMPQLTFELLRRGYTEEQIAKIMGGNLLRVMEEVQKAKK